MSAAQCAIINSARKPIFIATMKRERHADYNAHPLVQILVRNDANPARREILQNLDAASTWSLHVVVPDAKLLRGYPMSNIIALALQDISQGESGRKPFELLRNIIAIIPNKTKAKMYADYCLNLAIQSPWIKNHADFMTFIDILDNSQKINHLHIITSAIRKDAPFKICQWPETKATIDFICTIIRRKANSSSVGSLIGDMYKMRMKRQCSFREMMYIVQMPEMENRYAPSCLRYMDAIMYQNYNIALELWEQYSENIRNEVRNMELNTYVHGMFANHLLVWQESLQSFTSYFEHDASKLYDYLEHVIRLYGAPTNMYESIIYNLMHCTGKKDADRENAIVSAIIDKMQSSHNSPHRFTISCKASLTQRYMPFFRLLKRLYPTTVDGVFKKLLIDHFRVFLTPESSISNVVAAKICAAWTELRQLFPALELPDINCHLQFV